MALGHGHTAFKIRPRWIAEDIGSALGLPVRACVGFVPCRWQPLVEEVATMTRKESSGHGGWTLGMFIFGASLAGTDDSFSNWSVPLSGDACLKPNWRRCVSIDQGNPVLIEWNDIVLPFPLK